MMRDFILLFPCFVSVFWALALFLRRKTNCRAQNIWILNALAMGVSTCVWGLYFSGISDYSLFYKLEVLEAFSTLLLLPLLYFGFRALTNEKPLGWRTYLWLLPPFLITACLSVLYLSMGETQAVAYLQELAANRGKPVAFTAPILRIHQFISGYLYMGLVFVQIIIILAYTTVRLIRYRHRLDEYFSNLEGKSFENHRALLIGLYLILILSLVTYRGRFHYTGDSAFIFIVMSLWSVLLFYMGYNIYRLKYTADTLASELEQADWEAREAGYDVPQTPAGCGCTDKVDTYEEHLRQELMERLSCQLDTHAIYLNKNLRLTDLAREMRTNRTYVSRLINEEYHCSFSELINLKRITYAQELMQADRTLTQEQIALQCGFTQVTFFSRKFKECTGITFREWQKLHPIV